jgi:hypothetical protein
MNCENPCGPHYELVIMCAKEGMTVEYLLIKGKYKNRVPVQKWELLQKLVDELKDTPLPVLNVHGSYYLCGKFPAELTEKEFTMKLSGFFLLWNTMMDDLGLLPKVPT